jgi:ATP-dependent exoDNAse (exonuclease V) alpha subunit
VIALAPSAAAAAQLALSLRIGADTVAKWIHASDPATAGSDPWRFRAGQLVLIDEAAMASTNHLDRIASQATAAGAKVVLIGDHCQLGAVDAGGAFAVELDQLHRFTEDWESAATRQLRVGDPTCLDAYANHDRLHDGPAEAMAETAYRAWAADLSVGRHSLLLAADNATVSTLNARARADQVRNGTVHTDRAVALHDGTAAGRGDVVLTRRNERRLHRPDGGHVRNGDRWQVDAVHALTVHRAQGATAETTHLVADARMSREALYVGLTRGRHANHVYVATDAPETEIHARGEVPTGRQVLEAVLRSPASERSATSVLRQRQAEHVLALSRAGQWPPPVDESRRRDLSTDPRRQPPSRELSW